MDMTTKSELGHHLVLSIILPLGLCFALAMTLRCIGFCMLRKRAPAIEFGCTALMAYAFLMICRYALSKQYLVTDSWMELSFAGVCVSAMLIARKQTSATPHLADAACGREFI